MALDEFSLIRRYFQGRVATDVLGVGDDAARLPMPANTQLVVCKDLLIEGRHFFSDVNPETLGHKALAVNLSDLAAMGAKPVGCLLGLGLRQADPQWLDGFSRGLLALTEQSECPLLGGDTVRVKNEIVISVTALGTLPAGEPGLLRSHARPGDDIWVSGYLGAAHVALLGLQADPRITLEYLARVRDALEMPQPRLSLGQSLLGVARAAIDISDGLLQDLGHILKASGCGASIHYADLPVDPRLKGLPSDLCATAVLTGGDVYELCFTADTARRDDIVRIGEQLDIPLTRIGMMQEGEGLDVMDADGKAMAVGCGGFDHFRGA